MDTERWQLAGDIFEKVLDAPTAEREFLLGTLCGNDAELRSFVVSMLDSQEYGRPAVDLFATKTVAAAPSATERAQARDVTDFTDTRIGPWRLAKRIGAGGMGVVWLAERADGQFRQRAALKLIKRGMDSEAVLQRFLRERQILARLEHPNIAHLLDGGIATDGRPYFAMEYVEGLPLLDYCDKMEADLETRISVFLEICNAVQFAHDRHVVHRDLKPSNVLITAAGAVKLLDFGIAKLLQDDDEPLVTLTRADSGRPMTPAYAAPEQIAGEAVTTAADVYALGGVLYELLTGRLAHDFSAATDAASVLSIIRSTDPTAPSHLAPATLPVPRGSLRGDLDTIALTALKAEPERRYADVASFAADLRNYLAGKPIAARRDHMFYRGFKFLRRHRVGAVAWIAVLLIAATATALVVSERRAHEVSGAALAALDFANLAPAQVQQAWLAPVLPQMLATEVTQGGTMRYLRDDSLRSQLVDMPAPGVGGYPAPILAKLRAQLHADFVMSGSYFVSGDNDASVRVDVTVQDARNGSTLAHTTRTGALGDLNALITRTGEDLRRLLRIENPSAAVAQQIRNVQPPTTPVARHMGVALEALRRYDPERAKNELSEAVADAPTYALAHLYLSQAWRMLGYDANARASAERAAANSEGLPPAERKAIERQLAVEKRQWPEAIRIDRELVALDPADVELHLDLVNDLVFARMPDEAAAALAGMRELPGVAGDPRIERKAAQIAELRGDQRDRLSHAEAALAQAVARGQSVMAARMKQDIGEAHDRLGEEEEAERFARAAIADYASVDNPQDEATAHRLLATVLGKRGQPREQLAEFQRTLEIYERIGNRAGTAKSYANLGWMHWRLGDYDAARIADRKALQIMRDIDDKEGQVRMLSILANLEFEQSASDEVVAQLREAMDLAASIGQRPLRLDAQRKYVESLRERGELQGAWAVCGELRVELEQTKNAEATMDGEFECAVTALARGDIAAARAGFARAQQAAAAISNASTQGLIEVQLARIDIEQRDWASARERLRSACAKFEKNELLAYEAVAQSLLARVLHKVGDVAGRDRAEARARALSSRLTSRYKALLAEVALAQLQGDTGNRAEASQVLQGLADEAENRHWLATALEARLAAVRLSASGDDAGAANAHDALAASARKHGFGWISTRLESTEPRP